MAPPALLPAAAFGGPSVVHSDVFLSTADLSAYYEIRFQALFMDSGLTVQLKDNYALIVSHVSKLLHYTVLTGLHTACKITLKYQFLSVVHSQVWTQAGWGRRQALPFLSWMTQGERLHLFTPGCLPRKIGLVMTPSS